MSVLQYGETIKAKGKILHVIWFHLCEMPEKANLKTESQLGMGQELTTCGHKQYFWDNKNIKIGLQ